MAEIDLFDAFDNCIDRLNAGESIDNCVADYPEHAERLRQMLDAGLLVYQAQSPASEVEGDQELLRGEIVQMARRANVHRKRSPSRRRAWVFPAALAAVAALFVLGSVALLTLSSSRLSPSSIEGTSTHIIGLNATTVALLSLTETSVALLPGRDSLETTPAFAAASSTAVALLPIPSTTARPESTPLPTTFPDPGYVATSVALMSPEAPTHEPISALSVQQTATALSILLAPSAGGGLTPTYDVFLPGATLSVGGGLPTIPAAMATSVAGLTTLPPPTPSTAFSATPGVFGTPLPTVTTTVTATPTAMMTDQFRPTMTPLPQDVGGLPTPIQIIPLSAGEIDDNAGWDDYLLYRRNYLAQYATSVRDVDVTNRQIITVSDSQGLPVLGALVRVYDGQTLLSETRTFATGQTLFFPNARPEAQNAQSFNVVVQKGGSAVTFVLDPLRGPLWRVELGNTPPLLRPVALDVLFLLDTTGSMADEIAQLQNNILGISAQIDQLPSSVDVRYSLVTYRDRGDAYITQVTDFLPDVGTFQSILSSVRADGGGDGPESLNEGLHRAVQGVSWRGDNAVKLIFLVADAPPHLDYANDYQYQDEMVVAAQAGIKIHPLASSGLTPDGEYIFRQIAQYTMGHFLFLTYAQGTSGAPGESRPDLHVGTPDSAAPNGQGDYTVEQLDELVLRLITDELAALDRPVDAGGTVPNLTPVTPMPTPALASDQLAIGGMSPTLTPFQEVRVVAPSTEVRSARVERSEVVPVVALAALVALVVAAVGVAYSLHARRQYSPPLKRKNDEDYIIVDD